MTGAWHIAKLLLFLSLCACVLSDSLPADRQKTAPKKSRRKRRGCKCVGRYLSSVEKMMDAKLKEFKDVYLLPKLNEKKSHETQRMRDAMLRLSGDVAETKNALRQMNSNIESMFEDLSKTQKDYTTITAKFNQLGAKVANMTKNVNILEERLILQVSPELTTYAQKDSTTSYQPKTLPKQCQEVYDNGGLSYRGDYYILIKPYKVKTPFRAHCKQVNNSGWTVIQKRVDGSEDFYRNWADYKKGFGTLDGEFWIGNDNIHFLTAQEETMLRIEMEDWNGQSYYAEYDHFRVDGENKNYKLHISGFHGNAGDSMTSLWENHDQMQFSTKDKDNDLRYYDSCAQHYAGAWWFSNCFEAHLNGKYYREGYHKNYFQRDGIQWNSIHMYSSLKAVQMMIKPTGTPRAATVSPNDINAGP